ncbi:hypothetical protein ACA910_009266 [Epithemia clementina (nom. ined.)]
MTQDEDGNNGESPPRRLMITKMVLENFKSYAGIQEIGPFHHCFSSVVGPNGSGKSNVIDAMLFVFGKRAKQLRLNKIRELIHQSDKCKPTSATVTVFMQEIVDLPAAADNNADESRNSVAINSPPSSTDHNLPYRVIPNSLVELSRTAKSDNSSVYKLNGKTLQFRDVATFLKTKGIDLEHNRFLILQGEVELISMMPPKAKNEGDNDGLLEYLEDIIGSHTFVPATLEAAAKVEALTAARQEKLNRVKAAEQETKALEAAKAEAQSLLRSERDIRQHQNILYQLQRLQVQRKCTSLCEQRDELEAKLQACREKSSDASLERDELVERHEEHRREYEKAHEELEKTQQEFTAYERRDIKLRETIKHTKQKIKELEKKRVEQEKKEQDAQDKHDAAIKRIPELETKIQELKETRIEEEAKLEIVQQETRQATLQLRTELEGKTLSLAPLIQERTVRQSALETAETELNLLEDATKDAQRRLEEAALELENLEANQQNKQAQLRDYQTELERKKEQLGELEREEKRLGALEVDTGNRRKSHLARAEDAKAALQSKGGPKSSPAVQGILKAARPGGPLAKVGVLGRLGDLATIDAKYDVAVSTACGHLDNIVVQTTAGAQRCLDFLRQYNLGRANFIPLDKMKKGAHDRVVQTPEQAPRLLQLIQPLQNHNHDKVMAALDLAVSDTLVAPDLETATRWAYDFDKRWRVVTLDGKLLESAGTMSGGGKHVRRGGMKIRNARTEAMDAHEDDGLDLDVQALEHEAEKTEKQLIELKQKRKSTVDQIHQLKRHIKDIERLIPKLKMDIESFDTTRENLTQLIPQLKQRSAMSDEDKEKVKELTENVVKCKQELKSCIEQAAEQEADVERLQKAILDAGGSRLKKQQTKCDKILQEIKDAEKSLSSSKVAISSSEKAIKKACDARSQAAKQLEEAQILLEEKTADLKSLEDDAHGVKKAYERVKEVAAEKKATLEEIEEAVEKAKQLLASQKGKEIELVGQVDSMSKTLSEHTQNIRHWDLAIEKLITVARKTECELWEDDEDEEDHDVETNQPNNETNDRELEEQIDVEMDEAGAATQEEAVVDQDDARLAASYPKYSENALAKYDADELKGRIAQLETERNTLARNANLGAIAEYRKKEKDYLARVKDLDEVTEERNQVRREHDELRRNRLEMFMEGFSQITLKLKEMYQMITLGGDAELELVDSLDPFAEGIVFSVRPPKKSWKNISNLSGGEKTLSSLALVFALHHYKPTPLYVMDEIDAALDYKNVSIVANYIKERTKNAQFIIISLRNNMFELADRLVGIYKTSNCSKSVALNPFAFGVEFRQDGLSATPALRNRTNSMGPNTESKNSLKRLRSSTAAPTTPLNIAISDQPSPSDTTVA